MLSRRHFATATDELQEALSAATRLTPDFVNDIYSKVRRFQVQIQIQQRAIRSESLTQSLIPTACTGAVVRSQTQRSVEARHDLTCLLFTRDCCASPHATCRPQYAAQLPDRHSLATVDLIYPATDKHIAKYASQPRHMVRPPADLILRGSLVHLAELHLLPDWH